MSDTKSDTNPGWRPVRDAGTSLVLLLMLVMVSCMDEPSGTTRNPELLASGHLARGTDTTGGRGLHIATSHHAGTTIPEQTVDSIDSGNSPVPIEPPDAEDTASSASDPVEELIAQGKLNAARTTLMQKSRSDYRFARSESGRGLWKQLLAAEENQAQTRLTTANEQAASSGPTDESLALFQEIGSQFPTTTAGRQAKLRHSELLAARQESEASVHVASLEPLLKSGDLKAARQQLTAVLTEHPHLRGTRALQQTQREISSAEELHVDSRLKQILSFEQEEPQRALTELQAIRADFPLASRAKNIDRQQKLIRTRLAEAEAARVLSPVEQLLSRGELDDAEQTMAGILRDHPDVERTQCCSGLRARIVNAREDRAQTLLKTAIADQAAGKLEATLKQLRAIGTKYPRSNAARVARQREQQIVSQINEDEARELFKVVEQAATVGLTDRAKAELERLLKAHPELTGTTSVQRARTAIASARERKAQEMFKAAVALQNAKKYPQALSAFQSVARDFGDTQTAADAPRHENQVQQELKEKLAREKLAPVEQLIARGDLDGAQTLLQKTTSSRRDLRSSRALRATSDRLQSAREKRATASLDEATKTQKAGREADALKLFARVADTFPGTQAGGKARTQQRAIESAGREREAKSKLQPVTALVQAGDAKRARQRLAGFLKAYGELSGTQATRNIQARLATLENQQAEDALQRAMKLVESNRTDEALSQLDQIQKDYPSTRAATQARQRRQAVEVRQRDARAGRALIRVEQMIEQGKLTEAAESLDAAVKSDSTISSSTVTRNVRRKLATAQASAAAQKRNESLAQKEFAAAQAAFKAQKSDQGRTLLETLIRRYPKTRAADSARKRLKTLSDTSKQKKTGQ